MNPILPDQYHIPDVEARVFDDGALYLYGSRDVPGEDIYCSDSYDVFSTRDLKTFRRYPNALRIADTHCARGKLLYAPDCVRIGERYCLFYCADSGEEGVAFSNSPGGPFRDSRPILGADGDGIDPSVFVDDDGRVYYFWGQIESRGAELDTANWSVIPETVHRGILTEKEHGFHEGSSIRKRNGVYYYVYADISRGRPTCLGYATASSPLGPYTKRGIIIDNLGCDPGTWNNHGCIAEFNGQWYVFYHRSTYGNNFSRRCCVEPIRFNADGTIDEVTMSVEGADTPLSCADGIQAGQLCRVEGQSCLKLYNDGKTAYQYLSNIHAGDSYAIRNVDFTPTPTRVTIRASCLMRPYALSFFLDDWNNPIGSVCVRPTDGSFAFELFSGSLRGATGAMRELLIRAEGEAGVLGCLKSIAFI